MATNNRKKPRLKSSTKIDRISELPDAILLHILSFLPARDAVYTAPSLSKRWAPLRSSLRSLVFREHNYPNVSVSKYVSFVDATLVRFNFQNIDRFCVAFHCETPLQKFSYNSSFPNHGKPKVDTWVAFALTRKVKDLELLFILHPGHHQIRYVLPRFLFENKVLTSLSIRNCEFSDCKSLIDWSSLKTLLMKDTSLDDKVLAKIMMGCPLLECLKLVHCDGINNLDIVSNKLKVLVLDNCRFRCNEVGNKLRVSAPSLGALVISKFMCYKFFVFKNLSSLMEATFKEGNTLSFDRMNYNDDDRLYEKDDVEERVTMVRTFLSSVQNVKKLTFGSWCIQVLFNEALPYSFSNCVSLTLDINLKKWELHGISTMLNNCPKLEKLTINMWTSSSKRVMYDNVTYPESIKMKGLQHLKTVKIVNLNPRLKGGKIICDFLAYLLRRAKVLEELSIYTNMYDDKKAYQTRNWGWIQLLNSHSFTCCRTSQGPPHLL